MNVTKTLEEAQQQGFVVYRGSAPKNYTVSNKFFHWCEQTDNAFVRIYLKSKYATVEVDLIAQTWKPTDEAALKVASILEENQVGKMPALHTPGYPFQTTIYADCIPVDKAAEVAAKIVTILKVPENRVNDNSLARVNR